ncbi:MAG: hypothetical protein WBV82_16445 [Myxococcaceae bacterium]
MDNECWRVRVAEGPVGWVEQCSCGVLHVTVGPVSLRLEQSAAEALALMLRDGVAVTARTTRAPKLRVIHGEDAREERQ